MKPRVHSKEWFLEKIHLITPFCNGGDVRFCEAYEVDKLAFNFETENYFVVEKEPQCERQVEI